VRQDVVVDVPDDVTSALLEHGMLLQSARGPLPNVAELVAGEPIKGSWWGHPKGHPLVDLRRVNVLCGHRIGRRRPKSAPTAPNYPATQHRGLP
jgi:hypothetical protein